MSEPESPPAFSTPQRAAVLGLCALATALRAPKLVLEPRVYAEELTVHLSHAYSHGALQSLLLVPTSDGPAGYLQLPANLAAVLAAHWLGVENAAVITLVVSFLCQLAPVALVLFGRSQLWRSPGSRIAACALLVLSPMLLPEIWLTTISSQIFCGLLAFLLLFEDLRGQSSKRRWIDRGLLVFCSSSGVYTGLLTLPFFLRVALEKSPEERREAWIRAFLVAGIALLQAVTYLATVLFVSIAPDRLAPGPGRVIEVLLFYQALQPIVGFEVVRSAREAVMQWLPTPWIADGISLVLLTLVVGFLSRKLPSPRYWLFPCTFLTLVVSTSVLAFGLPRDRYAVLPGMVLLFWLLALASGSGRRAWVCRGLIALSLLFGVVTYRDDPLRHHNGEAFGFFGSLDAGRVHWQEEVELWRQDPRRRLRVWPYKATDSWRANLVARGAFDPLRGQLEAFGGVHLLANPESPESQLSLPDLPIEFRLVLRGSTTSGASGAKCEVVLRNAEGQKVMNQALDIPAGKSFVRHLPVTLYRANETVDLPPYTLTLQAKSQGEATTVSIREIRIKPRIQGLFDSLLPERALPSALYTASARKPLRPETTPLLALESLRHDSDLLWSRADASRAAERWQEPPEGLSLQTRGDPPRRLLIDAAPGYLLVARPLYGLFGPEALVVLHLVLLLTMAWTFERHPGRDRRLFLGSVLGSAGFGFVFLPAPQVFEAFCLFLPLAWWLRRELEGRRAVVGGLLLALAAVQNPLWFLFALLPLGEAILQKRWPPQGLVVALILGILLIHGLFAASTSPATERLEPAPIPKTAEDLADLTPLQKTLAGIRDFYLGAEGLLLAYPFLVLGLLAWLREPGHGHRLALGAGMLLVIAILALQAPEPTRLGDPSLAVLAPLVVLLPARPVHRWILLLTGVFALFVTLGIAATAWSRIG